MTNIKSTKSQIKAVCLLVLQNLFIMGLRPYKIRIGYFTSHKANEERGHDSGSLMQEDFQGFSLLYRKAKEWYVSLRKLKLNTGRRAFMIFIND